MENYYLKCQNKNIVPMKAFVIIMIVFKLETYDKSITY